MRGIAVIGFAMSCLLLPSCSGGTKGPSSSEAPAAGESVSEQTEPAAEENVPPEIVMEVIKTVLE